MQSRERISDTPEQGSSQQATQSQNMRLRQHRPIQRRASPGHSVATVLMGEAPSPPLSAPSGGGSPLPEGVRTKMEGGLGMDFSAVRVHEGDQAPAIGALAYTQGADIHFAPGQYRPYSQRGQEILRHELTHVRQQAEGRVRATRQMKGLGINDDRGLEREADVTGTLAASRGLTWMGRELAPSGDVPPVGATTQCRAAGSNDARFRDFAPSPMPPIPARVSQLNKDDNSKEDSWWDKLKKKLETFKEGYNAGAESIDSWWEMLNNKLRDFNNKLKEFKEIYLVRAESIRAESIRAESIDPKVFENTGPYVTEAAGKPGTGTNVELPVGTIFYIAFSEGQTRPGGFATPDEIPNNEYVRCQLAVRHDWKKDVSEVWKFRVKEPIKVKEGMVGHQNDPTTQETLPGGGWQFEGPFAAELAEGNIEVVGWNPVNPNGADLSPTA